MRDSQRSPFTDRCRLATVCPELRASAFIAVFARFVGSPSDQARFLNRAAGVVGEHHRSRSPGWVGSVSAPPKDSACGRRDRGDRLPSTRAPPGARRRDRYPRRTPLDHPHQQPSREDTLMLPWFVRVRRSTARSSLSGLPTNDPSTLADRVPSTTVRRPTKRPLFTSIDIDPFEDEIQIHTIVIRIARER